MVGVDTIGEVTIDGASKTGYRVGETGVTSSHSDPLSVVTGQFPPGEGAKTLGLLSRGDTPPSEAVAQREWPQEPGEEDPASACEVGRAMSAQEMVERMDGKEPGRLVHPASGAAGGLLPALTDHGAS